MERELTGNGRNGLPTHGTGPLAGKRVLDFSHVISGPYCAMMLADMGADVVKVERPGVGDDLRDEDYFNALNRRKRSIVLDLKDPADQATVRALVGRADVVIQNFAPGTAERLGIGPDELTIAGLSLSVVGLDPITGAQRFTFGVSKLVDGVPEIPVLIGLFALSEGLILLRSRVDTVASAPKFSLLGSIPRAGRT